MERKDLVVRKINNTLQLEQNKFNKKVNEPKKKANRAFYEIKLDGVNLLLCSKKSILGAFSSLFKSTLGLNSKPNIDKW